MASGGAPTVQLEVILPGLGDDEGDVVTVSSWLAEIGDDLKEGDDLLELTTDKAAFALPAPRDGVLRELRVRDGDEIAIGEVVCIFEIEA